MRDKLDPIALVFCKTRFIGFHHWPDAPGPVKYLSKAHRHEFHVEVGVSVDDLDREVEFHTLRRVVDSFCQGSLVRADASISCSYSCEMMALYLGQHLIQDCNYTVVYVEVSEDGENGARVAFNLDTKQGEDEDEENKS